MPIRINLTYIRAAILENTGIRLRIRTVADYLVEEGFITRDQANKAVFDGYESFSPDNNNMKKLDLPVPIDQELGIWEPIEEDELSKEDI